MSRLNIVKSICILKFSLRKQLTFLPPLVSQDVWETRTETPCWWRVTTKILVVFQSGWNFASTNKKHYPDLCSDTSTVWNICMEYLVTLQGNLWFFLANVGCFLRLHEIWTCGCSIIFNSGHGANIMLLFFFCVCEDLIKLLECAGSDFYQSSLWSWL